MWSEKTTKLFERGVPALLAMLTERTAPDDVGCIVEGLHVTCKESPLEKVESEPVLYAFWLPLAGLQKMCEAQGRRLPEARTRGHEQETIRVMIETLDAQTLTCYISPSGELQSRPGELLS